MCSARDDAALPAPGCPIRESAGQRPFSASPRLIAAVHALLRLLMPRHPPCALLILTVIKAGPEGPAGDTRLRWLLLCSFQGPRRGAPRTGARSLKTQQHGAHEQARAPPGPADISVDVGWLSQRGMRRPLPRPLQSWSFPRKEVIQPHLPVRLPCYDFTPVTGPTFDGSLPKGLGHRLRVLLASVV